MTVNPFARTTAILLAALAPLAATQLHAQDGPYKILNTVKVGGDGGFDYLTADPANRTLYVARSGAAGGNRSLWSSFRYSAKTNSGLPVQLPIPKPQ